MKQFCIQCGLPLVLIRKPAGYFDMDTGERVYKSILKCPRERWYRPFHSSVDLIEGDLPPPPKDRG